MNLQYSPPAAEASTTRSSSPNTRTKNNNTNTNDGSSIGNSRSCPRPYEDDGGSGVGWNESTSTSATHNNNHRRTRSPMANVTNRRGGEAQVIGLFKSVVGTFLNNCQLCTLYCDEQVRYETQQEMTEPTMEKDWIQEQYEIGTGSIGHLFTTVNQTVTTTNRTPTATTNRTTTATTTAQPSIPPNDTTTMGNWNTNHNITQDPRANHTNQRTLSLATIPTDNTTATAASKKKNHPQQVQSKPSTIVRL